MSEMNFVKQLKHALQFIAFVVFTIQVVHAMLNYTTGPTMVSESLKNISAVDRQVHISMCKMGQFNYSRSKLLGYESSTPFMAGDVSNKSLVSWTGANDLLSFDETLQHLFLSNMKTDSVQASKNTTNHFYLPFGFCTTVKGILEDILDNFRRQISFYIKTPGEYIIFISDDAAILHFQLPYPLMTGERLKISIPEDADYIKKVYHSVQVYETKDASGKELCTTYPTAKYKSYTDCVEKENRRRIMPALGCMVPWMSAKDTCKKPFLRMPDHDDVIDWIKQTYKYSWTGFKFRSKTCRLSCHLISTHAKYHHTHKQTMYDNKLTIYFEENVKVKTIGPAYGMEALIVEIGSSLGLWLGISIVGIFDIFVVTLFKVLGFLRSNFQLK